MFANTLLKEVLKRIAGVFDNAAVFLMDRGADSILTVFGQLAAILLSGIAVILMIISLFFPHEVE